MVSHRNTEQAYVRTPMGWARLSVSPQGLRELAFVRRPHSTSRRSRLAQRLCRELLDYFAGRRKRFSPVPIPQGTAFQRRVWRELSRVGYGQTVSYRDLAERVGSPKAFRAVGSALGANPLAVVLPCHRVVGHGGKLGGYAWGLKVKQQLLNHEARARVAGAIN